MLKNHFTNYQSYYLRIYPLIIALIAFVHFSPVYSPGIGSDQAITILQTYNFRLPEDLYYWGQDRLGSFVPLISNLIYRISGLNHIWVISVMHYTILVLGCISISKYFKSTFSKILFPLFWFIPVHLFIGLTEINLPQGVSLSFLSFFLYLRCYKTKNYPNRIISWVFLFIACWTSDLIILAATLYYLLYYIFNITVLTQNVKAFFKSISISLLEYSSIIVIVYFFKQITEGQTKEYNTNVLNSWDEINSAIIFLKTNFVQLLESLPNFQETFLLIFILSSILIVIISAYTYKSTITLEVNFLNTFFLMYGIIILTVFFASHWVYLNGFRSRYLIDMYVAFVIFSLLVLEEKWTRKLLIIPCVAGMIYSLIPHYYPEKSISRLSQLQEIKSLGKCAIISKYWYAYEFGCIYPDIVMGLPHDKSINRNPAQIHQAFEQQTIYLCKNKWLDSFPDSIVQYGYLLKKLEFEKNVSWYKFAEYKVIKKPDNNLSIISNESTDPN